MANDLIVAPTASRDIAEIFDYLSAFDSAIARRTINDLRRVLRDDIARNPTRYTWYHQTGQPYRARLYRLSRHTQYWIIFRHDATEHLVRVLRIWNASRDPAAFEL